jgi:hypothetical protein
MYGNKDVRGTKKKLKLKFELFQELLVFDFLFLINNISKNGFFKLLFGCRENFEKEIKN